MTDIKKEIEIFRKKQLSKSTLDEKKSYINNIKDLYLQKLTKGTKVTIRYRNSTYGATLLNDVKNNDNNIDILKDDGQHKNKVDMINIKYIEGEDELISEENNETIDEMVYSAESEVISDKESVNTNNSDTLSNNSNSNSIDEILSCDIEGYESTEPLEINHIELEESNEGNEKGVEEYIDKKEVENILDSIITNIENDDKEMKDLIHKLKNINRENDIYEEIKKCMKTTDKLKYIDLFCGIGGFHQALTSLGCECNLACDIDKACRENYELNYGIKPVEDVRKILPEELEDLDIITGGYPCQSFSNAGKKQCFNDDRGLLFDEIIRIAKVKNPKFMFLENVKHILKVDGGKVIEYVRKKLDNNNYTLQLFNMSPHNYGIPQQRERIYHVCVRKDIYDGKNVELPEINNKDIKLDKYMLKKEEVDPEYFIEGDVLKCLEAWNEMIQIFEVGEKISPVIMIHEHYNNHTEDEYNNYAKWRQEYITANKPLIKKYKDKWDIWYKKHEDILKKRAIFGKLEWQVGKIKPGDSIFNYFIQIRQSGIRVKKPHFFPTLVAINQTPIYGPGKRYITPRECARLQSFPEDFKIDEDDKHSYKQFGNSVNVDNVKTVIKATFDHYGIDC